MQPLYLVNGQETSFTLMADNWKTKCKFKIFWLKYFINLRLCVFQFEKSELRCAQVLNCSRLFSFVYPCRNPMFATAKDWLILTLLKIDIANWSLLSFPDLVRARMILGTAETAIPMITRGQDNSHYLLAKPQTPFTASSSVSLSFVLFQKHCINQSL